MALPLDQQRELLASLIISVARTRASWQAPTLPEGFPDWVFLLRWPEFIPTFCLAALVELKTFTGRVRPAQAACHAQQQANELNREPDELERDRITALHMCERRFSPTFEACYARHLDLQDVFPNRPHEHPPTVLPPVNPPKEEPQ